MNIFFLASIKINSSRGYVGAVDCVRKHNICISFSSFRGGSLVDHMLIMMEKYTDNLEVIVASRTVELEKEKEKTETLLYKMLPK